MKSVIAADIGGTNLRLAIVQPGGMITEEVRINTNFSHHSHEDSAAAEAYILDTLSSAIEPLLSKQDITAIGIGFPGFFIGDSGVLASSPNLPLLQDFALAERLQQRLGIHVVAQNDALCAAVGEFHFGAGKGCCNLLHITLGTGIGGGVMINGAPYSGEHGMAMEFGHLRVNHEAHANVCGCGASGCVEAYASATAVVSAYARETAIISDCRAIHAAAQGGDKTALQIIEQAGFYLGRAIAEASKLLDIETVTISGGLSGAWKLFYPPMMAELNHNLIPPLKGHIKVLPSTLHDQGGLLGAAVLAEAVL